MCSEEVSYAEFGCTAIQQFTVVDMQVLHCHLAMVYVGAPEPLALGKHNKPVLDLHTQVTEERVCDGPLDYVTRSVQMH